VIAQMASEFKGSKGFGRFSGSFGTRVREAIASQHREFFVVEQQKKNDVGSPTTGITPVPSNPENPRNPFEP
jgi:hypothetical protein